MFEDLKLGGVEMGLGWEPLITRLVEAGLTVDLQPVTPEESAEHLGHYSAHVWSRLNAEQVISVYAYDDTLADAIHSLGLMLREGIVEGTWLKGGKQSGDVVAVRRGERVTEGTNER